MAVAGAVATGVSIYQGVSGLFGGPSPDDERFQKVQSWYSTAVGALPRRGTFEECKLKYFSGQYGPYDCGQGVISGWATSDAKEYTARAYNQFLAVASGQLSAGTPLPTPGDAVPGVANTLATISEATGIAATALGGQTPAQVRLAQAVDIGKTVLVFALIGTVAYLFLRRR